ncbi:hypothetical protein J2Y41_003437 [Arthrobacter sp. 1088]|nr:hypothetical protein [Arthrobacter sp. 1088]
MGETGVCWGYIVKKAPEAWGRRVAHALHQSIRKSGTPAVVRPFGVP